MTKFIVNPNELEAVALAAGREETRYYLNGVNFERYADESGFSMTATDGHRMHTIRLKHGVEVAESFVIHNDDIKKIMLLVKNARKITARGLSNLVAVQIDATGRKLAVKIGLLDEETINVVAGEFVCEAIDGTFPDVRRAMPSQDLKPEPIAQVSFNAAYMADIGKAGVLLHGCKRSPHVRLTFKNGEHSPIEVEAGSANNQFLAVLIPVRF